MCWQLEPCCVQHNYPLFLRSKILSTFGATFQSPPLSYRKSPHETAACAHMYMAIELR